MMGKKYSHTVTALHQELSQSRKKTLLPVYLINILKLSSELQVKWLLVCIQLTKHPFRMCLISFLSSKKTMLQAECSQPGECKCVCRQGTFVGLMLMISFMQMNSIYFVIFIWRMRRIHHSQFKLMNYWPIVSGAEPRGIRFSMYGTVNIEVQNNLMRNIHI